jgi:hypothetical protein
MGVRRLLLTVVLLLAACSSVPPPSPTAPIGSPTPGATAPATPSTTPTEPGSAEWRVLARDLWLPELPFAVAVAQSPDDFEGLWAALSQADAPPAIDFATEMVVYMGMSGSSSCPAELIGLIVDEAEGRVYGDWMQPMDRPCTDDLAPQGVLLAVPRTLLPATDFLLSLRDAPICPDCPTHPDALLVVPTAP